MNPPGRRPLSPLEDRRPGAIERQPVSVVEPQEPFERQAAALFARLCVARRNLRDVHVIEGPAGVAGPRVQARGVAVRARLERIVRADRASEPARWRRPI